ncbi:MAG: DNA alkylation repair protein [Nanoarchaeota archaeon]
MTGSRAKEIMTALKSKGDQEYLEEMQRVGIETENAYGVRIPVLREIAADVGNDHEVAGQLWQSGIHEARILATMIDDPLEVTETQMEEWVYEIDSWDLSDQACANLFEKTPYSYQKALEWSSKHEEFVKRSGFVLMARAALADSKAKDELFSKFFTRIIEGSEDERTYVKKGISWALRQIGKRNPALHRHAIQVAHQIAQKDSPAAQWIAKDVLSELESEAVKSDLQ